MTTDANRRITRINPIAQQLTGWPQPEAVGRSIEEVLQIIHEETRFGRELQQLNADLERRIENRTRTLAESERRLRSGHRILETLTSDASLEQTLELIARSAETEDPYRCPNF